MMGGIFKNLEISPSFICHICSSRGQKWLCRTFAASDNVYFLTITTNHWTTLCLLIIMRQLTRVMFLTLLEFIMARVPANCQILFHYDVSEKCQLLNLIARVLLVFISLRILEYDNEINRSSRGILAVQANPYLSNIISSLSSSSYDLSTNSFRRSVH